MTVRGLAVLLGGVLALGALGCSDTGVGPADDDTADDDGGQDDDSSPADDDGTPPDDDTTPPDDDTTPPDDDTTPPDDDTADDDTAPPLPCEEVPGPPTCGDPADADCDGEPDVTDCDPADPLIHPGVLEVCGNGVDEDCDGTAPPCRYEGEVLLDVNDPTSADAIITTSTRKAGLGAVAVLTGDLNGDGWGDVLVGGTIFNTMLCVIEGPVVGLVDVDVTPEVCAARLDGVCDTLSCVLEVERAEDVNHDGYDDLLVSTNRTPGITNTDGAVMLFLGPLVGELGPDDAAFSLRPEEGTEEFPTQLGADASLGDVDGDGEVDLLAVDSGYNSPTGLSAGAGVFLGPLSGTRSWAEAVAFYIDADGHNGVRSTGVIADMGGVGDAQVWLRGVNGDDTAWYHALYGFAGLIPGSRDVTTADGVWISDEVEGSSLASYLSWVDAAENHGCGAMWATSSVVIGSLGAAYQLVGPLAGESEASSAPYRIDGTTDWRAHHVMAATDVNGDGWADVPVAHSENPLYEDGGAVSVVLGPVRSALTTDHAFIHYHGQGDDTIVYGSPDVGNDVDGEDVDGDGYGDLLISAPGSSRTVSVECNEPGFPLVAGCNEGAVFLVLGGP